MTAAEWIKEQMEADAEVTETLPLEPMLPDVDTIAAHATAACAAQFIIDGGGAWDETTSRMHCCEVVFMDRTYARRSLTKWALSPREAYQAAVEAWRQEREEGRAI